MSAVKKAFLLGISTLILFVFCMGAFLMPKTAKAAQIILPEIVNASFEQNQPFGWDITSVNLDSNNHGVSSEVFYDGLSSYKFKENEYLIKSTDFIAVNADSEYVFGFKFYSLNLYNTCKLSIDAYGQNGEYLYTADGETISATNTGVWQDVRQNFISHQNACKIKIKILVKATDEKAFIDDVYAHKNFVHTLDGASINLETTPTALDNKGQLRFTGKLDRDAFDEFTSIYTNATVGFMLIPTSHLEGGGEYTLKSIVDAGKQNSVRILTVEKWSNFYTIDEDGYYNFDCAIRGMSGQSLKAEISVRVFVKYYENAQEKYLYADYKENLNSRSVYSVAVMAKADEQTFNSYSEGQKEKINAYIEGREPNLENLD